MCIIAETAAATPKNCYDSLQKLIPKTPTNAPIVSPAPTAPGFSYTPTASPTMNPYSPFFNYQCDDVQWLGAYCFCKYNSKGP